MQEEIAGAMAKIVPASTHKMWTAYHKYILSVL